MPYPPDFSSTLTYANRYDLDEIDVFLEGNSSNPMFFSLSGLPKQLSFGKHYFNLSVLDSKKQEYELRPNSRILFEFKSINNAVLRSDVTSIKQKNGVAVCFVEVLQDPLRTYMDITDGEGTLTIVGSLQNKQGRGQSIPEKFREAINYRCVFPIEIRKNLLNSSSPRLLSSEHKLSTTLGQFSFVKGAISTRRNTTEGTSYKNGNPLNTSVPKGTTS